jgi:hypothetical protein
VGAALLLTACGSTGSASPAGRAADDSAAIPTSTVATPTARSYIGPNGLPIETGAFLAPSTTTALGGIVRGIQCEPMAQLAYTSYAHLLVYYHGRARALPGGIGLVDQQPQLTPAGIFYSANTCMYWLHTRAADGLIEAESPVPRRFTLGEFFAIWRQPLNAHRVARSRGHVTATVNGRRWTGPLKAIPLTEHADIQLTVGRPGHPTQPVNWDATNF